MRNEIRMTEFYYLSDKGKLSKRWNIMRSNRRYFPVIINLQNRPVRRVWPSSESVLPQRMATARKKRIWYLHVMESTFHVQYGKSSFENGDWEKCSVWKLNTANLWRDNAKNKNIFKTRCTISVAQIVKKLPVNMEPSKSWPPQERTTWPYA
jgi:hypothetical protein